MTQREYRAKSYFNELRKFIDNQNYAKIVKTCNKILAENNSDIKAWQCKLTALIHLGNFSEGIQCLKNCKVSNSLLFEKAYCEYRLNNSADAFKTISEELSDQSSRVKELKAQILYRLERFDECFSIYRDLIKNLSDPYDQERLTNLLAVAVNRSIEGSKEKFPEVGTTASYEQLYNKGCGLLVSGKHEDALKVLQEAKTRCIQLLEQEGGSEEETIEETAVLRVQEAYCLHLMGREHEALSIYNNVMKKKPDDPGLLAILSTNIVAINREANVFDSKKKMKATQTSGLEHKLTSRQQGAISLNHCILAYHMNQDDICDQEIIRLKQKHPLQALPVTIVEAARLAKAGKFEESSEILKQLVANNPKNAIIAVLSSVQILLSQGKMDQSIDRLLSLNDSIKFRFGILSALVILYSAVGRIDEASNLLKIAVQWHKENKTPNDKLAILCRQVANFHLKSNDAQTAVSYLGDLRELDPTDTNILAELISAYSQFDTEMAKKLSKDLPSAAAIVSNFDVEALVSAVGMKYVRKAASKVIDSSTESTVSGKIIAPTEQTQTKKKKKKKRVILPKHIVKGVGPNPDRWLPKWQRPNVKRRKERRNKDAAVGKGTQGVSSDAADKFDITKTAIGEHRTTPTTRPQIEWSGPKRNMHKAKRGKKKK